MLRLRILLIVILVALLATPSFAYTLYLKDGSTISCKGPYEVRKGNAYFTYPNGNQGFLKMDLIDIEKTKLRNESDIGGAAVIQEAEIVEKTEAPAPRKRTLGDMIRQRNQAASAPVAAPPVETPAVTPSPGANTVEPPKTSAGYLDLSDFEHIQLRDLDLAAEILKTFRSQSVDVRIYQGTRPTHPLVAVTANSEGAVLRAVAVAASALGQVREQHGDKVEALELLISTPTGQRAGQFVITPALADDLLSSRIDPTEFYVKHVQF